MITDQILSVSFDLGIYVKIKWGVQSLVLN